MDMQDRELDDIFRSKLDGFEAEPTERVWKGIGAGLDNERRKGVFMPILRIAASVIILLTVGLFFIMHKEEIKPVKHEPNKLVQNSVPAAKKSEVIVPAKQTEQVKPVIHQVVTERIARTVAHKQTEAPGTINNAAAIRETPQAVRPTVQRQPVMAAVTTPVEKKPSEIPVETTQLTTSMHTESIAQVQETKALVIPQTQVQQPAAKPVKRHGIHNMGDLVNLVVAKVDKRKEKLIQFSNTDDDDSNLTAVNIGPIKLNREDKSGR